MTLSDLKASIKDPLHPTGLSVPLQALWYAAHGNWEKAHHLAQDDKSPEAAWVHAHLHRQEGDISNARYWYTRAGKDTSGLDLKKEWDEIARALLERP